MLLFLLLVLVLSVAVFLVAYRFGHWLCSVRKLPADIGVGGYLALYLCAMVLVGIFVASGAQLTQPERLGFGMLLMALTSSLLLPWGLYRLKKQLETA